MFKNKTTIIVEDIRNELHKIGRKEQTYTQIIKELIKINKL